MTRLPIAALMVMASAPAGLTLIAPVPARAEDRAGNSVIPVRVAGSAQEREELIPLLQELLFDVEPTVLVRGVGEPDPAEPVPNRAAADRIEAWVLIEHGRALLRVAGDGHSLMRELPVSVPLTEIDRERIGHALRVGLATILETLPDESARKRAEAPVAVAAPEPQERAHPPAPGHALAAEAATRAVPAEPRPPGTWQAGATYELQRLTICRCGGLPRPAAWLHSLGLLAATERAAGRRPYELFAMGRLHVPMTVERNTVFVTSGLSVYLGGSVTAWQPVQLGLGLGLAGFKTRLASGYAPDQPTSEYDLLALARAFLRLGPLDLGPLTGSAVVLLEVAHRGARWVGADGYLDHEDSRLRPGLGLELRWR